MMAQVLYVELRVANRNKEGLGMRIQIHVQCGKTQLNSLDFCGVNSTLPEGSLLRRSIFFSKPIQLLQIKETLTLMCHVFLGFNNAYDN